MKKLLIMGTSYGSEAIVKKAKTMGIYTIVTDFFEPEHSRAKLISDEYWMISTNDIDALEKRCRKENISGITAGVSEFNLECSRLLCERLGLPIYYNLDSWKYATDKRAFKDACAEVGAPIARDYFLSNDLTDEELDGISYPVVVKPVDQGGNVGMSYCHNKQELIAGYRAAQAVTDYPDRIIVEKWLSGEELYGYYAIADGEPELVLIGGQFAQPGQPNNRYAYETNMCGHLDHYVEELDEKVKAVFKHIGCKEGVAWVQTMLDDDNHFYITEMGQRLGADLVFVPMADIGGFDLIKWMIECALGIKHSVADYDNNQRGFNNQIAGTYMLWSEYQGEIGSISGLDEINAADGIDVELVRTVGDTLEGIHPIVNVLFSAQDAEEACKKIAFVNENLKVTDKSGNNIVIYYDDFDKVRELYNISKK